ncbi:MAG TPA: hypothetical protein DER56_02275 [Thermosipho africanus]|nr:hypothetical protein [Thermosipho africanus]
MKENFRKIVIGVAVVAVVLLGGFGLKMWDVSTDRVVFKNSATYNEGVLDDLAQYKYEMQTTEDEIEKKAICELVNSRFANYDESKIENDSLKYFLIDCRNGVLN